MKVIKRIVSIGLAAALICTAPVHGAIGDFGFSGGISEGERLMSTTELMIDQASNKKKNSKITLDYKEVVFISGTPTEIEGLLTITRSAPKATKKAKNTNTEQLTTPEPEVGTYNVTYNLTGGGESYINRKLTFAVSYRIEGNQKITDYKSSSWTETVVLDGETYLLDRNRSNFNVSIISDQTAGVEYYKGNLSQQAVYTQAGEEDRTITHDASGDIYGYISAWSSTETHRIDGTVIDGSNRMQYQVRPSVSLNKLIQYSQNEPTAISFEGNYREVMQNTSALKYDIFVKPISAYEIPSTGSATIPVYNTFEQLIAPDLSFLKGHAAESDIAKLFSMKILGGESSFYKPDQAITRGEFIMALAKAIKLPVEPVATAKKTSSKTATVNLLFPDLPDTREDYPYILSAYKSGIAVGRSNGYFYADSPIQREEAIVMLVRAVGLSNLAPNPTPVTSFMDDYEISDWAKRDLYAAQRIDLIRPDIDGNIHPKENVSKAEAATFINRLVDYMRTDLGLDYIERIVNYSK